VEYREARIEDAKALLNYKKQVYSESEFLSRSGDEYNCSVEEEVQGIEKIHCTENALTWLAIEGEIIVGCLNIRPDSLSRLKHSASIGVSVRAAYRGKGVGKMLMNKAITFFNESTLHRLELTVVKDNDRAVTLYKKLGFEEEGILRDSMKINGHYFDMISMAMIKKDENSLKCI